MSDNEKSYYKSGFTIFGSDGKLKQIEYAKNSVSNSLPVLGIQTTQGVVLVSYNTSDSSDLLVSRSIDKIHKINRKFGLTAAGHMTDGKKLAEKLREKSVEEQQEYGSIDDTIVLIDEISEHMQETINSNEFRPYGVSLLITGIDYDGDYKLYKVEPDGATSEWLATAIGKNQEALNNHLEDKYVNDMSIRESTELLIDTLVQHNKNIESDEVTVAKLTQDDGFVKMNSGEVDEIFNSVRGDKHE